MISRLTFVLIFAAAILGSTSVLGAPPESWGFVRYEEGMKNAGATGRPMLIIIGFENCPYCRQLYADTMSNEELRKMYAADFIRVYIDRDGEGEHQPYALPDGSSRTLKDLLATYGSKSPTVVWADPTGKVLESETGNRNIAQWIRRYHDKFGKS